MPNPVQPPNRAASGSGPEASDQLDEVIRAAMNGTGAIETVEAMLAKQAGVQRVDAAPVSEDALDFDLADMPSGALKPLRDPYTLPEGDRPPRSIPSSAVQPMQDAEMVDAFDELNTMLIEARRRWEAGLSETSGEMLARMQVRTGALRTRLREMQQAPTPSGGAGSGLSAASPARRQPGVSVRMVSGKTVRQPYSLYIECPNDASSASRVGRALGLDSVSAHSIAVCRYPRAARRGDDREWLEAMAERYRAGLSLQASVIPREALLDIDHPKVVLGPAGRGGFQVSSAAIWAGEDHDPLLHGSGVQAPSIHLAVPGSVVAANYRLSNRGRGRGRGYILSREERIGVIDLHGPGVFLRVIENVTDFSGLPGHSSGSTRRSFRGFLEQLEQWFPEVQKLGPRVCRPGEPPEPDSAQPVMDVIGTDGWSSWEEHTRHCRLMFNLPPH